jgi:hypothetical protein
MMFIALDETLLYDTVVRQSAPHSMHLLMCVYMEAGHTNYEGGTTVRQAPDVRQLALNVVNESTE